MLQFNALSDRCPKRARLNFQSDSIKFSVGDATFPGEAGYPLVGGGGGRFEQDNLIDNASVSPLLRTTSVILDNAAPPPNLQKGTIVWADQAADLADWTEIADPAAYDPAGTGGKRWIGFVVGETVKAHITSGKPTVFAASYGDATELDGVPTTWKAGTRGFIGHRAAGGASKLGIYHQDAGVDGIASCTFMVIMPASAKMNAVVCIDYMDGRKHRETIRDIVAPVAFGTVAGFGYGSGITDALKDVPQFLREEKWKEMAAAFAKSFDRLSRLLGPTESADFALLSVAAKYSSLAHNLKNRSAWEVYDEIATAGNAGTWIAANEKQHFADYMQYIKETWKTAISSTNYAVTVSSTKQTANNPPTADLEAANLVYTAGNNTIKNKEVCKRMENFETYAVSVLTEVTSDRAGDIVAMSAAAEFAQFAKDARAHLLASHDLEPYLTIIAGVVSQRIVNGRDFVKVATFWEALKTAAKDLKADAGHTWSSVTASGFGMPAPLLQKGKGGKKARGSSQSKK